MSFLKYAIAIATVFTANFTWAVCTSPAGNEGEMFYNTAFKRPQFCDGTDWINMTGTAGPQGPAGAGGGVVTLVDSRTTLGTWTLSGVTIGKPIFIVAAGDTGTSGNMAATIAARSGTLDGTANSARWWLIHLNDYSTATSNTFMVIPTATTVTFELKSVTSGLTLRAYQ